MADLILETTATIPAGATVTVTVFEDSTGDGTADASASQQLADGTHTDTLGGFDGAVGNDIWFHVDSEHSPTDGEVSVQSVSITSGVTTSEPVTRTGVEQTATLTAYDLLRTRRTALVEPALSAETHLPTFEMAAIGTTVTAESFVDLATTARPVTSDLYDFSLEPVAAHAREASVAPATPAAGHLVRAGPRPSAVEAATLSTATHGSQPPRTSAPVAGTVDALAPTDDLLTYAAMSATATVQAATSRGIHPLAAPTVSLTGDTTRPTPTLTAVSLSPTTTDATPVASVFTTAIQAATVDAPGYRRRIAAAAGGVFDIAYVDGQVVAYRSTATPPTTITTAYTHRPATTRSVATETARTTAASRERQPRPADPPVTALTPGVVVANPRLAAVVIAALSEVTAAGTPFVRVAPTVTLVNATSATPTYTRGRATATLDAGTPAPEETNLVGLVVATADAGTAGPEETHVAGVLVATAAGLVYLSGDMILALEAGGDTTLDTNPRSHRVAKFKNR